MHGGPWACSKRMLCCSAFAVLTTIGCEALSTTCTTHGCTRQHGELRDSGKGKGSSMVLTDTPRRVTARSARHGEQGDRGKGKGGNSGGGGGGGDGTLAQRQSSRRARPASSSSGLVVIGTSHKTGTFLLVYLWRLFKELSSTPHSQTLDTAEPAAQAGLARILTRSSRILDRVRCYVHPLRVRALRRVPRLARRQRSPGPARLSLRGNPG